MAYFSGEALWTYLNTPFLYTQERLTKEEIGSIEVEGETWRRLRVIFPEEVKSHTRQQIFALVRTDFCAVTTAPSTSSAERRA